MSQQFHLGGMYRIICHKKSARNSPGEPWIVLDNDKPPLPSFEHWKIEDVHNGFTIQNVATGLYAHFDELDKTLRLSSQVTRWYIHPAGGHNNNFRIALPDNDIVWTNVRSSGTSRETQFELRGADGSSSQQIQLVKVKRDHLN